MKSITDLDTPGADDLKSARGARLRSAPHSKETSYLDMFLLRKKQVRGEKEQRRLERKKKRGQGQLAEISDDMQQAKKTIDELEMEKSGEEAPKVSPKKPAKKWQTMTLDY